MLNFVVKYKAVDAYFSVKLYCNNTVAVYTFTFRIHQSMQLELLIQLVSHCNAKQINLNKNRLSCSIVEDNVQLKMI